MNFNTYSFKDLLSDIVDNRGKTCPVEDSGMPLIATNCIKENTLYPVFEKVRYVSDDTYKTWFRGHPKSGDMIFVCKGSPGRVNWVPYPVSFCIAQDMVSIRADETKVYPKYLFALLRSKVTQQKILNMHVGTLIPHFKKGDFGNLYFDIPEDMDYQKKVGDAYFDFCLKIEANSQLNKTLEEMAQTIFKSWFVDFDPVKAKMNGEQPEGMDAATASLFPEKLVESELGLIPEGWSVEEAKSQLDVLRGFSYKGKGLVGSLDEGVPMHNLNSVLEGGGYKYAGLKFYSEEFKEKFAIQEGDVLVANTEQGHNHLLIGYGAMVPKHLAHGFFSHHTYRVRPKKNSNMTPEFIERLFGKGRFARQVQGFTNGTTVNMLPTAGMEMPQFVVPPKALAQKFSELVKPMKAMIEENHKSNIELAKLRDTLLPKLLSGEIELKESGAVDENDVVNRLLKQMDFGVKSKPRKSSIPNGHIGYITTSGTFGSDGGTFVDIPKAVQALTKITSADGTYGEIAGNALTENVLSGAVELATNNIIPLGVLTKICTAVFGKKTPIKPRNAVLLTSIHQAKNKTLDSIMNEQAKRFRFLEQSSMDEQEFGESLRYLESIGVVKCEEQHITLLDTIVQH